jgi:ubiquinone/menaquinone biosynthesis C-methylase UbiE
MHAAFTTWNVKEESLEAIERRIHDGFPEAQLRVRAEAYVDSLLGRFPWARPAPQAKIMEIGGGVGYVMEAALRRLDPAHITGLDVAENMIEKARQRLERDGVHDPRIGFLHYDGIHVPLPDDSFDYIYSVACIQHIPKPFAYHLFYEIHRLLKPRGFAALHTLSVAHLPAQVTREPFQAEVARQLQQRQGHWHHYYSFDELFYILSHGVGVDSLDIQEGPVCLWVCFSKESGQKYHDPNLPRLVFSERKHQLERD